MRKKVYGDSRIDTCPFCDKAATVENDQGIPVCQSHRREKLLNLKCMCGSYLDIRKGKWGPYCQCFDCGNVNLRKALEINPIRRDIQETTVTSDELDFI